MRSPRISTVVLCSSAAAAVVVSSVDAYTFAENGSTTNRRSVLQGFLTAALAGEMTRAPLIARAVTEDQLESVYFGIGCFWHIQHELVEAERALLGRGDAELTSLTGYAGGNALGPEGRVCYHNLRSIADYGKLGHGEVVGLTLPQNKIVDFSKVYFSLFDPNTGDRVDPQDKGPEYRSLIGLPGGKSHVVYGGIETAAANAGFKLVEGKGNDPDTLRKRLVFVYDTSKFPFYQAEVYHQFHNDFQSAPYGKAYNSLADAAFEDGRIKYTGCPDRV